MKEQIPEEEQKQDKLSSQEILNCMKIIFYLSLFLGFIWTLFTLNFLLLKLFLK